MSDKPIEKRKPLHEDSPKNKKDKKEEELQNAHQKGLLAEENNSSDEKTDQRKEKPQRKKEEKPDTNEPESFAVRKLFLWDKLSSFPINKSYLGPIIISVIAATIIMYLRKGETISIATKIHDENYDERQLSIGIDSLENKYTLQDEDTWITLLSGIKSVLRNNPNQPSVFLMLYTNEAAEKTAECIAEETSKLAAKFLIKAPQTPLKITPNDLNHQEFLNEPGHVLVKYNSTIRERGALVVTKLHEVPASVAEIFHYICDKYAPLVEKAVLFFTLKVDRETTMDNFQEVAHQSLNNLWVNSMKPNILSPLITRLTTNIISITSDRQNC